MGNRSQPFHKHPIKLTFKISRYPDKTSGQKIRKYRLERELKQIELARLLKVDEMTIVNWELDKTKPRDMLANRVNRLLGTEIYPIQTSALLGVKLK
ncbi:MAG: helix-turn-helix transcriptional regulator [Candidatus Omnitrophica bacterium]|nr:helix-turn-helix transcriptional regulator [Candidatus Omnitrophota bacterium]